MPDGFITTGALIVGAVFYPLWVIYMTATRAPNCCTGFAYLGGTTGSAPSRRPIHFMATRASTGVMIPPTPVCIA